jgi:hypothetical protein
MLDFDQAFALFEKICDMSRRFSSRRTATSPRGAGKLYIRPTPTPRGDRVRMFEVGGVVCENFRKEFLSESNGLDKAPDGRHSLRSLKYLGDQ